MLAEVKSAWLCSFGCNEVGKSHAQSLLSVNKNKKEATADGSQPSPDKPKITYSAISMEDVMRRIISFRSEIKQTTK